MSVNKVKPIREIYLIHFNAASALRCKICEDSVCEQVNIPIVECNKEVSDLPYGILTEGLNAVSPQFTCLDLEYSIGECLLQLRS